MTELEFEIIGNIHAIHKFLFSLSKAIHQLPTPHLAKHSTEYIQAILLILLVT